MDDLMAFRAAISDERVVMEEAAATVERRRKRKDAPAADMVVDSGV